MKILIAEDDPLMMAVIKQQLSNEGYTLSINTDGREALEALESFMPDLIITDILMPFTSGLDLISVVRSSGSKTPILVLSAMDQEATVLEALSLGANDFISKPFKPAEISMRVKRLLKIK
jgi:two-component system response regulator VicR